MPHVTDSALSRLREAADQIGSGWSPAKWTVDGQVLGSLDRLELSTGRPETVHAKLDPPAALYGTSLAGDRLELTVRSIYPVDIAVDGEVVLAESIPPVATGPALIEAITSIEPGHAGLLSATVRPPGGQGGSWPATWFDLTFTTPRLRARFEELDLAWARLALANELAATSAERTAVEAAARLIPDSPLFLYDADTTVLEALVPALEPMAERIAAVDVHVIGHSHIDLEWLWTWDDTREVIKRDIRSVLALMRDYPEVRFTHSQPAGYEVVRQDEPALFAEVVRHVQSGRWEPATAQWVECDTNLVSGEAMVSQLLEGVTFTREHLGVSPEVCLAPDTFGHSANLPQLLASAGVEFYYHHRANPGARTGRRWPAYWWEGLGGARVLACSTASYNGTMTAGAIARAAIDAARAQLPAALLFVGVGDHGGGPTRQGYDTLRRVGAAAGMPRARSSTVAAYARQLASRGTTLPVHRGESPTIFEGCYTTHVDAKQANRDAENRLSTAEALAAMAALPRDPSLTESWRATCFHQFHDILDGSAIPEAYVKTHSDHAQVVEATGRVVDRALSTLTGGSQAGEIAVVNPHGHACTDIVVVRGVSGVADPVLIGERGDSTAAQLSGDSLVFLAHVPAFGVAHYRLTEGVAGDGPSVVADDQYIRVETRAFRAVVRRDCGILTSLLDKRVDTELVAFGMRRSSDYGDTARPDLGLNVFQIVDERPHFMSSWQYQEVHAEHTLIDGATTEVVETGPVRVVLRVNHRARSSTVAEDIVFYHDSPRVDFVVRVGWQEPGGKTHGIPNLKIGFTPDLDDCEAWFEVPYGAVRRRSNGQQVPALRWADIGGSQYGVAVLNDGSYGHDVLGNRLRLNLVRTAYVPDPRSDCGNYTFRLSLVPHLDSWRAARIPHLAALFNQPLLARRVGDGATPMGRWVRPEIDAGDGLVCAALRPARNGNGTVLRLAEAAGSPAVVSVRGLSDGAAVWQSDLTERRLRRAPQGPWSLRPWEVRTWIVEE
jgi:alpha-mannosidase